MGEPAVELQRSPDDWLLQRLSSSRTDLPYCEIQILACEFEVQSVYVHRRFLMLEESLGWHRALLAQSGEPCELVHPTQAVFLDIETTGLTDTPLFLIGLMECSAEEFIFRQYFARNYTEEPWIIAAASDRLRGARVLVTFNGTWFDIPYIRRRAVANGVYFLEPKIHLDLLLEARRRYGGELPNCKLQTLEQMICGRFREDDISSSEVPDAYLEFMETGNLCRIVQVVKHNLYDLLAMADLASRMLGRE